MTTTRTPNPLAADGVVVKDADARALVVKPATVGYAALLWREGHRALVEAEAAGNIRTSPPIVWGLDPRRREIARGRPGPAGTLRFTFPTGDPAYKQLVSTPFLHATVVVDRATSRIMNVRFHGRRS